MQNKIILDARNIYKKFGTTHASTRKLIRDELFFIITKKKSKQLRKNEYWFLKNISFKLHLGETLGIIGPNGAGKSTLLKMINGLLIPDFGEIHTFGKVGGFIELSAGFQPNLTGKQNIYLKCSLLGLSKKQIDEKYKEIHDFCELGNFINSPYKNYSSGMKARLGFSVMLNIKPDILLLDEILSVGDYRFRAKCMSKLNSLRDKMSTILVSHSMSSIRQYCDNVIILEKGEIVFYGNASDAVNKYLNIEAKTKINKPKAKPSKEIYGPRLHNIDKVKNVNHYWQKESVKYLEDVRLNVEFTLKMKQTNLQVGVAIYHVDGSRIAGIDTINDNINLVSNTKELYKISLKIPNIIFNSGEYVAIIVIVDSGEAIYRGPIQKFLQVTKSKANNSGYIEPQHEWIQS